MKVLVRRILKDPHPSRVLVPPALLTQVRYFSSGEPLEVYNELRKAIRGREVVPAESERFLDEWGRVLERTNNKE